MDEIKESVGVDEQLEELRELIGRKDAEIMTLQESTRQLEIALQSDEWRLLTLQGDQAFSPAGLQRIREISRLMALKNPIIKRGVKLKALYTWAMGVNITARDARVNRLVQAFLGDERNQAELGEGVRMDKDREWTIDGELFFRFFVNRQTGRVRVRTINPDEISEIVTNPEDSREPWFYKRSYTKLALDGTAKTLVEYYPDYRFNPLSKNGFFEDNAPGRVVWDTPVYHEALDKFGGRGVSEVYDAQSWSLSYKNFLEDLATVWRGLSRWAAKLNVKGGKRAITAAKSKLATTINQGTGETNPPPMAGSMFIGSNGTDLQPFRTAGATMSAEDGRRLFLMAISSMGFPETFYGDVSVGTLATARALDRPTELMIVARQGRWATIYKTVLGFACKWAVKAPAGALRSFGRIVTERDGAEVIETVAWNKNIDPVIDIDFPPVVERNLAEYVGAVGTAAGLSGVPNSEEYSKTLLRLVLSSLMVKDVDSLIEDIFKADPAGGADFLADEDENGEAV